MTQILRAQPAALRVTFPAPPGAVAVDVARLDGTLLRNAALAAVSGNAASIALTPADTALLDTLTASFTSATIGTLTARVEIVGAVLFTVAEARAFDKLQLASAGEYGDEAIEEARERITDQFQRICGIAFVPRYRYSTIAGEDWYTWSLPDQPIIAIRAVGTRAPGASTYVAYTPDQLAALESDLATGIVTRGSMYYGTSLYSELRLPSLTLRVGYEYGYAEPPPAIKRAALIVAANQLVTSNISERTMSFSDQNGQTFRYATPGIGRSYFGLPQVDAVLAQYRETQAGIV